VVGVLDGQVGEGLSTVEGGEFVGEDVEGPAVGGDVVHDEAEDVVVVGEPDESGAQERPGGEVERFVCPLLDQCAGVILVVRLQHVEPWRGSISDLDRSAVDGRVPGAQDLVAGDDGVECPAQGVYVERAA
jgi:hypothetical protein